MSSHSHPESAQPRTCCTMVGKTLKDLIMLALHTMVMPARPPKQLDVQMLEQSAIETALQTGHAPIAYEDSGRWHSRAVLRISHSLCFGVIHPRHMPGEELLRHFRTDYMHGPSTRQQCLKRPVLTIDLPTFLPFLNDGILNAIASPLAVIQGTLAAKIHRRD
ncbi:hypothetical protein KCU71_g28, partial [Aureobasidium melanogenum]